MHSLQTEKTEKLNENENEYAVEVENLVYFYDRVKALDGASLKIKKGEKVAILGPNGSGKTTLMLSICGLVKPESGRIRVMGVEVSKKNESRIREVVGIVFQNPDDQVFSATVYDDVAFGLRNMGLQEEEIRDRVNRILRVMKIEHLAERNPANLSGGEKKKVAIAGVIVMNPPVLLIDEPTAGLDHAGVHEIFNILTELNARGLTVIVTTHDSEFAFAWADRIIVMNEGKVVSENAKNHAEEDMEKIGVKLKLPGKEKVIQELTRVKVLNPGLFEHLRKAGLSGKVRVVREGADYCYGLVDFEFVEKVEFDLDIIALDAYTKEVRVAVSENLANRFAEEMSRRGVKVVHNID